MIIEFNKSNVKSEMRKVRIHDAIKKMKSEVLASDMDKSKKVGFFAIAKMISESELGRVSIHSDSRDVQERIGITELSSTPKVGLIRRFVDPETHENNEDLKHMTPEELVDYAASKIEKSKWDEAKEEVFYEAVRKELNGQIAKTSLTENDRLYLEGIAQLVTSSPERRFSITESESIGISTVTDSETGKEEHRLALYRKHENPETGEITEETIEKSLEDLLIYAFPKFPREPMEEGRRMAIRERARKKIIKDIEASSLPEEKQTELKAVLQMALSDSLGRVSIKSSNPRTAERVGVVLGKNPKLTVIRRFRDPETGMGEEQVVDMQVEELSKYIETRIPEDSREEIR